MTVALTVTSVLMSAALVQADSFTGLDMDFVDIGNAGNTDDGTGYGAVDYSYRMGVNEVSQGMITAYNNATNAGPDITFFDLSSNGGNGVNKAASGVSWNEAARFVNWLNTDAGFSEAYKFTTGGANDNIALWTSGDTGYDASNPFRNSNAHYFLPSEDEWYKAAYYDSNTGTYSDFATGSDTAPTTVASGTTEGTAVYGQPYATGPADITNAGGLSSYGTMAQNGNVGEWGESGFAAPNDAADENRVFRGGSWSNNSWFLQSSSRLSDTTISEGNAVGFRVASVEAVPEPSSVSLILIGAVGFLLKRKRA